jgi:Zn-dependent membrane protease YugP
MIFDPLFLLFMIPGFLIGLYAQAKLSSTYKKHVRIPAECGLTGAQSARAILDRAGLGNVAVREIGGHLTDHYHPLKRALYLSSENYHGRSLAALGVAAHEAGHALQHKDAYKPLQLRMMLVPATQFASMAYLPILILGMILQMLPLMINIIIGIFAVITLFQIITLPVEFNASSRAKAQLLSLGLISNREHTAIGKVLNAAALTYVAAMVTSMLQLLYWILIARNR